MAKLSRGTKETIQTILVLVAVIVLVLIFIVYPVNRTGVAMGRADKAAFANGVVPTNDPSSYVAEGWTVDTFRVESDGLTKLACLYITPQSATPRGTVIVVPSERQTRDSVIPLVRGFLSESYAVVTYDQRASGRSTNTYHSDGQMEATDLQAVISYLDIHGRLRHPLVVVGYAAGGDAALLTSQDEPRIDALAAIAPYLTTGRLIDGLRAEHHMLWLPFFKTIFWWWYKIRSGYAAEYRDVADLTAPAKPTVVFLPPEADTQPAVRRLREIGSEQVVIRPVVSDDKEIVVAVLARAAGKP